MNDKDQNKDEDYNYNIKKDRDQNKEEDYNHNKDMQNRDQNIKYSLVNGK